jgi:hypothetical protein
VGYAKMKSRKAVKIIDERMRKRSNDPAESWASGRNAPVRNPCISTGFSAVGDRFGAWAAGEIHPPSPFHHLHPPNLCISNKNNIQEPP